MREKKIIEREGEEVDFLWQVIGELSSVGPGIGRATVAMVAFNMVKYHIILLNRFIKQFGNSSSFVQKHSQKDQQKLSWKALLSSPEFK